MDNVKVIVSNVTVIAIKQFELVIVKKLSNR